jgi:hypothetical protein
VYLYLLCDQDMAKSPHSHCLAVCSCPCLYPPQPDMGYPGPFLGRANQAAALADLAERCGSEARALATTGALAGPASALADEFARIVADLQRQ